MPTGSNSADINRFLNHSEIYTKLTIIEHILRVQISHPPLASFLKTRMINKLG